MASYKLEDGELLNEVAPDTFWMPPREARQSLSEGDIVKLIFRIDHDGKTDVERMWVVVKASIGTEYIGELNNQPYCTSALAEGSEIQFAARHVIQIWEDQ